MRALCASISTVAAALVLAFFAADRLCMLHEAYELRRAKIDKEAWLREQCTDPVFFSNMGEHTTLCREVEATYRIGAAWYALNTVAESLPVADFVQAVYRVGWPALACVAVVLLVFPSLIVAQWRASAAARVLPFLPAYYQHLTPIQDQCFLPYHVPDSEDKPSVRRRTDASAGSRLLA